MPKQMAVKKKVSTTPKSECRSLVKIFVIPNYIARVLYISATLSLNVELC